MDDVYELLEFIGDSAIPHRDGEKVSISTGEARGYGDDLVPKGRLLSFIGSSAEHRIFGAGAVTIEFGKAGFPQLENIDLKVGTPGLKCR